MGKGPYVHAEFPKMLNTPHGLVTVASAEQEAAVLSGGAKLSVVKSAQGDVVEYAGEETAEPEPEPAPE